MINATFYGLASCLSVALTISFFQLKEVAAEKIGRGALPLGRQLEVRLTSAAIDYANPEYVGKNSFLRITRTGRDTPPAMFGCFPLLKDWPMDVNLTFVSYHKVSNKWMESFAKGTFQLCEMLESNRALYRVFYDYTNFPRKCPVRKGNLTINKFDLDNQTPPPIAGVSLNQEWKSKLSYWVKDFTILTFSFGTRIQQKREVRRPGSSHSRH